MRELFLTDRFDEYSVRVAKVDDTNDVLQLLRNVAFWLEKKGIQQWEYLRNGGEDGEIRQDITSGTTYVVEDNDKNIVATFNLSPNQNEWDVAIWGERKDNAYYLHRLAVSRDHSDNQIGSKLLHWIDENNSISEGYLRLDCIASNPVLNRYYEEAGYTFIGCTGEGENTFSRFEKVMKE
ncbi:GNAT family N-acetyltransferase [Virgibacillus oceani]|uniref:N-acetyltransferase n=1 Tax=Virgibacillus oceani TaxID=1479511 RepID=A0A917HK61_9BACI|nr:GNAT family N-acetyltransferase [Virgibacillus oceani]GGG81691.1 N-acetyltransferase [Virgibacillus oceani]